MTFEQKLFDAKPLESFFPGLVALPVVKSALEEHFKEGTAGIRKR